MILLLIIFSIGWVFGLLTMMVFDETESGVTYEIYEPIYWGMNDDN